MRAYIPNFFKLSVMQVADATKAVRLENVRDNNHRGVGPWVTRRPGWRQKQRRKLARRTA